MGAGGLEIRRRAHDLSSLQANDQCSLRHFHWVSTWREHSFLYHLRDADEQLRLKLHTSVARGLKLDIRSGWQGRISTLFRNHPRVKAHLHLRRRLDRWNTRTLPGWRVQRVEKVLDAIASAVNPRVISAYIRLICNGWITARRFQRRALCSFACGAREDSIEHYAKCSAVMSYFRIFLGLQRPDVGLELDHFLCMDMSCDLRTQVGDGEVPFDRICRLRVLGC